MRKEKQLLLDEIKEKIESSNALVLTQYQSLKPNLSADFRMKLMKAGGGFAVVKKRVLLKAAEESGLKLDESALEGHIGVGFATQDPVAFTKAISEYAKENKETFAILGGQFEGKFCTADDVRAIADLPSQDVMRAQFIGLLEAPMSQTLSVIQALLTSIMYCLENKAGTVQE